MGGGGGGTSRVGDIGTLLRGVDPIAGWRRWPVEWTAVSRTGAADLSRALGEGRSVTVLPNAIDVDRWRIDQPAPHDDVHIVAVMRLARRKRPLPLLEMLRCVRERMPDDVNERGRMTRPAIGGWNVTERATGEPARPAREDAR